MQLAMLNGTAALASSFFSHPNIPVSLASLRTGGNTMKLMRYLPGVLVAFFLLTGTQAKAQEWAYPLVCDSVFGSSGGCYADDYIPNLTVWDIDYFSDCTFTTSVGGDYRRYHTSAHVPDYHTGWNRITWGVTSDFRTVDADQGYKYQQVVNGAWQDIEPCSP